ncbi:MAG: PEP-CTERM sorting domain-containing protein [Burkholderiaceae bacterium]|nr:PEP-CTERM sorting domain-containing protein [Burkholderiaceae bacterium]
MGGCTWEFWKAKKIVGMLGLLLATGAAVATPVTYTFTGTVDWNSNGDPIGSTVSASLTVDPATFTNVGEGDGSTYLEQYGIYFPPTPSPMSGSATTSTMNFNLGGGDVDDAWAMVDRNAGGDGFNEYWVSGNTEICSDGTCYWNSIYLNTWDFNGLATNIFQDPNAGLDVTQPVNFMAAGTFNFAGLSYFDGTTLHEDGMTLDSVSISTDPANVPEPATVALFGIALAGLGLAKRKPGR